MTDPHLDDEQLSLLLDGLGSGGRVHVEVEACDRCGARLAELQAAREALASTFLAPLPPDVLDRLVARAIEAGDDGGVAGADVVPIGAAPRRRGFTTPPPAWLLTAAAALVALVGVAGLLRVADRSDDGASLATVANDESSGGDASAERSTASAAGSGSLSALDPEVVSADLADQDDPATLARALGSLPVATGAPTSSTFSAAREASPAAADAATDDDKAAQAESGAAAPATTGPTDRARCRAQAEEIGAGRFAALLSTATLRWKGEPAEALVFLLAEPSDGGSVTRQALVLSRPGCGLLADLRF